MAPKNQETYSNITLNTIRLLAVEAVTKAKSGHPGIALGAAPIMYVLFKDFLNVDVSDPKYFNRDRFILSAGHGSALLYATMLVSGYNSITLEDLKKFRQLHSKTPGHPERSVLEGVDIGTGPLGQGIGAAVGFAMAEAHLNASYQANGKPVIDHYTYCLFGDGDLEEGVGQESLALAGRYRLNKLIFLYDSNGVQLDGNVRDSTLIDVKSLCKAYGLNYLLVEDGNDCQQISNAIKKAQKCDQPTLIEIKTIIGFGSDVAGKNKAHGSPLSEEQVKQVKETLGYNYADWTIPSEAMHDFQEMKRRGFEHHVAFKKRVSQLHQTNPEAAKAFEAMLENKINFDPAWFKNDPSSTKQATRDTSGIVLNEVLKHNKHILVINNDLSSSTKIYAKNSGLFDVNAYHNQNINVGVREFSSGTISLGIEAHGGCQAIASTFLSFADYVKASIRLSAINQLSPIFVFSHDSITVGEDGPTHQPVEQLTMLRTIPNANVFRPANLMEMVLAFGYGFSSKTSPTIIVTSRVGFSQAQPDYSDVQNFACEVLAHENDRLTIAATGSEVASALDVAKLLDEKHNIKARVVSINCLSLLEKQPEAIQKKMWGELPIFIIEFGVSALWKQYTKHVFGIETYGESGPANQIIEDMGLSPATIADKILQKLS